MLGVRYGVDLRFACAMRMEISGLSTLGVRYGLDLVRLACAMHKA